MYRLASHSSAGKACLLNHGGLCVPKNANHIVLTLRGLIRLEELVRRSSWRQQKHDPIPQEAQSSPLLFRKVIYVFPELLLLRIVLRYESHNALNGVFLNIFEISSVRNIEIVVLVAQITHNVGLLNLTHNVGLH